MPHGFQIPILIYCLYLFLFQDTIEDRALISRLLDFVFTNIYHETRSIFRENLDMLKTLLECWKERIEIPYV